MLAFHGDYLNSIESHSQSEKFLFLLLSNFQCKKRCECNEFDSNSIGALQISHNSTLFLLCQVNRAHWNCLDNEKWKFPSFLDNFIYFLNTVISEHKPSYLDEGQNLCKTVALRWKSLTKTILRSIHLLHQGQCLVCVFSYVVKTLRITEKYHNHLRLWFVNENEKLNHARALVAIQLFFLGWLWVEIYSCA